MSKVPFGKLPFIVQFATTLSFFIAWVCFEEFVIDPARARCRATRHKRT
jgi:hypothetical protein